MLCYKCPPFHNSISNRSCSTVGEFTKTTDSISYIRYPIIMMGMTCQLKLPHIGSSTDE